MSKRKRPSDFIESSLLITGCEIHFLLLVLNLLSVHDTNGYWEERQVGHTNQYGEMSISHTCAYLCTHTLQHIADRNAILSDCKLYSFIVRMGQMISCMGLTHAFIPLATFLEASALTIQFLCFAVNGFSICTGAIEIFAVH